MLILDSFYTFWLIIQTLDPDFQSQCEIPSLTLFMSQQVCYLKMPLQIIFNFDNQK